MFSYCDIGNRSNPSAASAPAFVISVLEILLKACETRHPRLMEIGLDALHYLIGKLLS